MLDENLHKVLSKHNGVLPPPEIYGGQTPRLNFIGVFGLPPVLDMARARSHAHLARESLNYFRIRENKRPDYLAAPGGGGEFHSHRN